MQPNIEKNLAATLFYMKCRMPNSAGWFAHLAARAALNLHPELREVPAGHP
jgi:hypothetical protein